MENNANKEKWISEVIASTNGMHRASPGKDLFEKITSGMASAKTVTIKPFPITRWAAAAILLLALNVGAVLHATNHRADAVVSGNGNPIATAIQEQSTYNY